ncbi:AfsR/SARP family transcriptional regulator [Streptomyces sp. NBC_00726]|uniref:AfsR/SARP family transcriptional regulator n=1 Tax=Streptomyces sp. NBC_00726 TaxID=2903674 RepID=UPI00386EFFE5
MTSFVYELWESEPPRRAVTTVQTYVVHLRKLLVEASGATTPDIGKELLQTNGASYRLTLPGGSLDLHEFRRLLAAADGAVSMGRDREAVSFWQQADALWHGDVLADVEHGPLLRAETASLRQSRLSAADRRIEAQLRLGLHQDTLSELAGLVQLNPLDEGFHAKFMLALHRSGYRARALQVYYDLRRAMSGELGIEPSRPIQQLLQDILSSDSSIEAAC